MCFFKASWSALVDVKPELLKDNDNEEEDVSGFNEDAKGGGLGELIFTNDW